jgi:hypothetical protein
VKRVSAWCLLAAGLAAGCAPAPSPPADTGAREMVRDYCDALVRQDWPQAYARLDAAGRKRCGPEEFARLARAYRRGLGFEPDAVRVRACEEQGATAIAHVVFTGQGRSGPRHYNDALTLRHDGDHWVVVLPARFG